MSAGATTEWTSRPCATCPVRSSVTGNVCWRYSSSRSLRKKGVPCDHSCTSHKALIAPSAASSSTRARPHCRGCLWWDATARNPTQPLLSTLAELATHAAISDPADGAAEAARSSARATPVAARP